MKKYKPKNYKKRLQEEKRYFQQLRSIIRRYSAEQWLLLIRTIDMKNMASPENIQYKGEFLILVADTALRLTKPNMQSDFPHPNSNDLKNVLSLYFSYDKSPVKLIKAMGISALPLIAHWQNKFRYSSENILGRMHLLYQDYNQEILEATGLTVMDLHIIILTIYARYGMKDYMYFKADAIISSEVNSLSREKVDRFLHFFAIDMDGYRREAKSRHIYDNQVGKFNLLNRYPIIQIDQDQYIIPSKDQLIDSVAANLYFHILEFKQKSGKASSKAFLDSFGKTLENYAVLLAEHAFGATNVVPADEIVTDANEDRCEVVCMHDENALAIEVKKLHFQRDAIINADIEHIQDTYDRHLRKGLNQLVSTLRYIEKNRYGLIVIPDTVLSSSGVLDQIKYDSQTLDSEAENNILICTISEYEQLMANPADIVFKILDRALERTAEEGTALSLILENMQQEDQTIELINPLLDEKFKRELNKQAAKATQIA